MILLESIFHPSLNYDLIDAQIIPIPGQFLDACRYNLSLLDQKAIETRLNMGISSCSSR